ncbi:hypothetical protein AB0E56_06145 [Microbacterium sp. NPDC028030]|uniref:hypothetical protein n=1 Tax=Microbacterium sp. NPDC028030 TaxID=3155124 RepID=UPI0033F7A1F6
MGSQNDDRTTDTNPSESSVRALVDAISRLTDDPEWLIAALTDMLRAMRAPVPPTKAEVEYLLSSGAFTPTQVSRISDRVVRGSLTIEGAESFLSALHATWPVEQVASYLDKPADHVLRAVDERELYAVTIAQRLRFPVFQFNIGHPEPLIPHLRELVEAVGTQRNWISTAAFMATRQASLVAVAMQTPRDWLLDGGSFDDIQQILDSARYR